MTVVAMGAARDPVGVRWLGVIVTLVAWELAARALAGSYLLAGPIDVGVYLWQNAGLMGRALAVTGREAAFGFVLGNLAAVLLAAVAVTLPRTERLLSALALLVFCLPLVATGPILRVLYGPGEGPQVTLAALAVYYTTFVPLMVGLRAVPPVWFDLLNSYGRGRWAALVQVRAPAALPYLAAGLQIAAPAAFLGAMVGEFTGAERGMGVLAIQAMRGLDVTATWALATVAAGVSVAAYAAVGWLAGALRVAPPPLILAPPPSPRRGNGLRRAALWLGGAALTWGVVLALWWGAMALFGLNAFFAKRPGDVWDFLIAGAEAGANRAVLGAALAETMAFAVPGYLAGLGLGAGLAMALVLLPGLAAGVMPVAIALRSVPIITTAPLIVLALGRGQLGTVSIVAVMIFFPTLVACLSGMRQTPGQVIDLFDSYGASRLQRLAHAQLPAMLPAFFAAARMAVPAALLAATTAEWLATGRGIGALMALTASTSAYGMLWSATVVVSLVAVAGYLGVGAIERAVLRRHAAEQVAGQE
jgi:ABC-type nitrate/sulfonate/bicarbonate transport system permease component